MCGSELENLYRLYVRRLSKVKLVPLNVIAAGTTASSALWIFICRSLPSESCISEMKLALPESLARSAAFRKDDLSSALQNLAIDCVLDAMRTTSPSSSSIYQCAFEKLLSIDADFFKCARRLFGPNRGSPHSPDLSLIPVWLDLWLALLLTVFETRPICFLPFRTSHDG